MKPNPKQLSAGEVAGVLDRKQKVECKPSQKGSPRQVDICWELDLYSYAA